jgi:hypothetical protein
MGRKQVFLLIIALAFFLQIADNVKAETVSAKNPNKILEIAKGYGDASLGKDNDGDPIITGKIDGIKYGIYFYGCTKNKDCDSIQFRTGWTVQSDKPTLLKINAWNKGKRFGKAYLDSDGDPTIEINLLLSAVPVEYLENYFDWWKFVVKEFKEYFDL